MWIHRRAATLLVALTYCCAAWGAENAPPAVGDAAPDFALTSVAGQTVRLAELTPAGPVLLVVLRGYPGYQ